MHSCRLPDSASRGVVFRLRISPRIRSQNRNGSKCSVRNLGRTDLCKNPRKSASLPCPFNLGRCVLISMSQTYISFISLRISDPDVQRYYHMLFLSSVGSKRPQSGLSMPISFINLAWALPRVSRNSVDTIFREFFVLPYLPYSVRNCGITCRIIGQKLRGTL